MRLITALPLALISCAALAEVPFAFQAGTPARASEVNQNFQSLDTRVDGAIGNLSLSSVERVSASGTSVVSAACPDGSTIISSSCECDSVSQTRNFGTLFSCVIAGNSAIVGCFSDSATFTPSKPPPRGGARATCLHASAVNGASVPLVVTPRSGWTQANANAGREEREALDRIQRAVDEHAEALTQNR